MDALHFYEANSHSYLNSKRSLIHPVSAAFNGEPIIVSKAGILIPVLLGKSEEHKKLWRTPCITQVLLDGWNFVPHVSLKD